MKQEFKTNELRQTAESIRDAVLAKSITPDMVGGTMLALVNASGEVIEALGNLESERVTVKVQGYNGQSRVDIAGAKVYLDQFSIGGVPTVSVPRQEFEVDENGEVTFEVLKGYQYAVFSKLEGMAASFQFTYEACQESRTIELWHFPVGVWMLAQAAYYDEDSGSYRAVPYISDSYISDLWSEQSVMWDASETETGLDDVYYLGVMVATEASSFVIEVNSKAESVLCWSGNRYYGKMVPSLPAWYIEAGQDWGQAQALARADYDGNLNTAKILTFCKSAPAAEYCSDSWANYNSKRFLPSAGQLYLIYLNKTAINALMTAANENGEGYQLIDNNWYWSSSQYDGWCAWYVLMGNGNTYSIDRLSHYYVRAVSAFHFIY